MKKIVSAIITALTVVTLCICLSACSAGVEGTYKFSSMTVQEGSTTVEIKAGEKYMGMIEVDANTYVLQMKGDKTWEMKVDMGSKIKQSGSWEEKDGKYLLSVTGETEIIEATLDGKTLTFKQEGVTVVLKK